MNTITTYTPKIYVACLAAYNNGRLHGTWIDATLSSEEIREEVEAMLKGSPEPYAEEWSIHDYSDFGGFDINEYDSFNHISEIANMLNNSDHDPKLLSNVYHHLGSGTTCDDVIEYIENNYSGCFDSLGDWAHQFLDETCAMENVSESIKYYFNYENYARDAEINGEIFTIDLGYKQLHVFYNR